MPVFYSERVKYEGRGEQSSSSDSLDAATFPFFFAKEDLDRAYVELQQVLRQLYCRIFQDRKSFVIVSWILVIIII